MRVLINDPRIKKLRDEVNTVNEGLVSAFGRVYPRVYVDVLGRLGLDNPASAKYYSGERDRTRIQMSDASYVDVHVRVVSESAGDTQGTALSREVLDAAVPWSEDWPHFTLNLPKFLPKRDSDGAAHCEDGPWLTLADGTELWAWHGFEIERWWILEKHRLTLDYVLTLANAEQRRTAIDIAGWVNLLKDHPAKVIDTDADEEVGELIEVNIPNIGRERFLRVLCATGRTFVIPVPPETRTAIEGQAWLWGETPATFVKPEVTT